MCSVTGTHTRQRKQRLEEVTPLGLRREEGATGQGVQEPLEAGKDQEADPSLESPEAASPASRRIPVQRNALKLCCFKPLSL